MYVAKDTHKGRIGNPFLTISQGKFTPATRISDHITDVGIVVNSVELTVKFYGDALRILMSLRFCRCRTEATSGRS
jgi:hypothetical protein